MVIHAPVRGARLGSKRATTPCPSPKSPRPLLPSHQTPERALPPPLAQRPHHKPRADANGTGLGDCCRQLTHPGTHRTALKGRPGQATASSLLALTPRGAGLSLWDTHRSPNTRAGLAVVRSLPLPTELTLLVACLCTRLHSLSLSLAAGLTPGPRSALVLLLLLLLEVSALGQRCGGQGNKVCGRERRGTGQEQKRARGGAPSTR